MINVSNEFRSLMKQRTDFIPEAQITLTDDTVLNISTPELLSPNSLTDAANASGLPIGEAICRTLQLTLENGDDQYEEYSFLGAKIRMKLRFALSETTERIDYGKFTVTEPEEYGTKVTLVAKDDMYKADRKFVPPPLPTTAGAMLSYTCNLCGIPLSSANFRNSSFQIDSISNADMTCREVIGHIAAIAVGNARINRGGSLEIISYSFPSSYGDYEDGDTDICVLEDWINSPNWFMENVEITAVEMTYGKNLETEITVRKPKNGQDTYVLTFSNPLVAGHEEGFLANIWNVLEHASFMPFSGDHISYPIAEFMDPCVLIDHRRRVRYSVITDVDFSFLGSTTFKNSAKSPERNSSQYQSSENRSYQRAKRLVDDTRGLFDEYYRNLEEQVTEAPGYYVTREPQQDGSVIFYAHNKPTIEESEVLWKKTALTWSVSTSRDEQGNRIWNAGIQADGNAVLRILTAEGVNADWINAGTFTVQDTSGNIVFQASKDTHSVFINSQYAQIGETQLSTKSVNSLISDTEGYADTAANDALSDANTYTDGKLVNYYTQTEVDQAFSVAAGNVTSQIQQITRSVSSTYETKTDAQQKLTDAKDYTTTQLRDYVTTTTFSTFQQSVGSFELTVSSTYETKTDATTKLNDAKQYTDSQVTTAKSEIKETTDSIEASVTSIEEEIHELNYVLDPNFEDISGCWYLSDPEGIYQATYDNKSCCAINYWVVSASNVLIRALNPIQLYKATDVKIKCSLKSPDEDEADTTTSSRITIALWNISSGYYQVRKSVDVPFGEWYDLDHTFSNVPAGEYYLQIYVTTAGTADGVYLTNVSAVASNSTLKDYYYSAIKLTTDTIESTVKKGDFGSYLTQYYDRVILAFNDQAQYTELAQGYIAFYDQQKIASKQRMKLDEEGTHFYRDGYSLGYLGSTYWSTDPTHKGLAINLEPQGKFISFGYKASASATDYTAIFAFSQANSIYTEYGLHLVVPTYITKKLTVDDVEVGGKLTLHNSIEFSNGQKPMSGSVNIGGSQVQIRQGLILSVT